MEIKEFGKENRKKIMLIPGTMMCWKQFESIIPLLQKDYHVMACGIVHSPKLIVMDEPTVGIDPQSRNRILENV